MSREESFAEYHRMEVLPSSPDELELSTSGRIGTCTGQLGESNFRHPERFNTSLSMILRGTRNYFFWIFQPILYSIIARDIYEYYKHPERNFGNTISNIIFGNSTNENTWSSNWGCDRPDQVLRYWAAPIAIASSFVLFQLLYLANRRHNSCRTQVSHTDMENRLDQLISRSHGCIFSLGKNPYIEALENAREEILCEIKQNISQCNKNLFFSIRKEANILLGLMVEPICYLNRFEKGIDDYSKLELYDINELYRLYLVIKVCLIAKTQNLNLKIKAFNILINVVNRFDEELETDESDKQLNLLQVIRDTAREVIESLKKDGDFSFRSYLVFYAISEKLKERKARRALTILLGIDLVCLFSFLIEIFTNKTIGQIRYNKAKSDCEGFQGSYTWIAQKGQFECNFCGDWSQGHPHTNRTIPFISYRQIYSTQSCLNGLLSGENSPQMIIDHLDRLVKIGGFTTIDLSKLSWRDQWTYADWNSMLTKFESNPKFSIEFINLSQECLTPYALSNDKIKRLARFIKTTNTKIVDLSCVGLDANHIKELMPSFYNSTIEQLDLSGNLFRDEGMTSLSQGIPFMPKLRVLKINQVDVTDVGMRRLADQSIQSQSSISRLSVKSNYLQEESMQAIVDWSTQGKLRDIDFSDIDWSAANVEILGPGLRNLDRISLASCNLEPAGIRALSPYLMNANVQFYNFSHNELLSDFGVQLITSSTKFSDVKEIDLSFTGLTDAGLLAIKLPPALEKLYLDGNNFTPLAIAAFFKNLTLPKLHEISLAFNRLADSAAIALSEWLQGDRVWQINFANNFLTYSGGLALLNAVAKKNITSLSLASNPITCAAVTNSSIFSSGIETLNLSNIQCDDHGIRDLVIRLPKAEHLTELVLSNNPITDGIQFAKTLYEIPYQADKIGDEFISRDLSFEISNAHPTTIIQTLRFDHCLLGDESAYALCRVSPPSTTLSLYENSMHENLANCQISAATRTAAPFPIFQAVSQLINSLKNGSVKMTTSFTETTGLSLQNLLLMVALVGITYMAYQFLIPVVRPRLPKGFGLFAKKEELVDEDVLKEIEKVVEKEVEKEKESLQSQF